LENDPSDKRQPGYADPRPPARLTCMRLFKIRHEKALTYAQTMSSIHPMTDSPEIDFEHLNQYVGGDLDLTREVFGLFRNQVEMWGKGLVADADDDMWSNVTHSLKGSARAVGAVGLAAACETAESLVGDDRRPGAREVAVETLELRIEQVLNEIIRWEYEDDMRRLRSS